MTRFFLIDAFTDRPFGGNPAAVCITEKPLPESMMPSLAAEFGASETAFVHREGEAWRLRWFSPLMEIPLCGHGTLATARALLEAGLASPDSVLRFETLSGTLRASLRGERVELDFPARPAEEAPLPAAVSEALGLLEDPLWTGVNAARNWLIDLGSAEDVAELRPDREAVMALGKMLHGIIVTGAGDSRAAGPRGSESLSTDAGSSRRSSFTSRFFAPEAGVFEDPVTGSAHCALAPYWAAKLSRTSFAAWQASARGGLLDLRLDGNRVYIAGESRVIARGSLD